MDGPELLPAPVARRATEMLPPADATHWCATAPRRLAAASDRWQVQLVRPVLTGRGGLLWYGTQHGTPVAMKLPLWEPGLHVHAQRLLAATSLGPDVLASSLSDGVLLLRWVDAEPLRWTDSGSPHQDRVAAALDRLRQNRTACTLPSLAAWLDARLARVSRDLSPRWPAVPRQRRDRARVLLDELGDDTGFVHGDLTPGNVLVDRHGNITLIDARGVAGDPTYDLVVFVAATHRGLTDKQLAAQVRDASSRAGHDPDRAAAWLEVLACARA